MSDQSKSRIFVDAFLGPALPQWDFDFAEFDAEFHREFGRRAVLPTDDTDRSPNARHSNVVTDRDMESWCAARGIRNMGVRIERGGHVRFVPKKLDGGPMRRQTPIGELFTCVHCGNAVPGGVPGPGHNPSCRFYRAPERIQRTAGGPTEFVNPYEPDPETPSAGDLRSRLEPGDLVYSELWNGEAWVFHGRAQREAFEAQHGPVRWRFPKWPALDFEAWKREQRLRARLKDIVVDALYAVGVGRTAEGEVGYIVTLRNAQGFGIAASDVDKLGDYELGMEIFRRLDRSMRPVAASAEAPAEEPEA